MTTSSRFTTVGNALSRMARGYTMVGNNEAFYRFCHYSTGHIVLQTYTNTGWKDCSLIPSGAYREATTEERWRLDQLDK